MRCATLVAAAAAAMVSPASAHTDVVTVTYEDPSRKSLLGIPRKVTAKLCMPAEDGQYPLYLFGHGAGCAAADYAYFCSVAATAMVYHGDEVLFPADFDSANAALDAQLLRAALLNASAHDAASPVYQRLNGAAAYGGHSMGGGMVGLALGMDAAPADGVAVFAPGTFTKPDAAPFLHNITVPVLVVSGSQDCGSNALDKMARPFYGNVSSARKVLVVLGGADHCQWANDTEKFLGVCHSFVKNECHSIDAATQQQAGVTLLNAFLPAMRSSEDWDSFEALLASGEAKGTWTYKSSVTSDPSKQLHNQCPCSTV
eukprot:Hpha_TRINITY_DN35062_c0_g1::TRINITY_DN35062_c0_g1_i1::g.82710::m.82710